jgi:hypothetical protein
MGAKLARAGIDPAFYLRERRLIVDAAWPRPNGQARRDLGGTTWKQRAKQLDE